MRVKGMSAKLSKELAKNKSRSLRNRKSVHKNVAGRVKVKDMGKLSYMFLKMYERIEMPNKMERIIDLFETYQAQKDVFKVDEVFNFRTRAERFKHLNDASQAQNVTAPHMSNCTMDNSQMPLMTGEEEFDDDTTKKSDFMSIHQEETPLQMPQPETGWSAIYERLQSPASGKILSNIDAFLLDEGL